MTAGDDLKIHWEWVRAGYLTNILSISSANNKFMITDIAREYLRSFKGEDG